MFSIRLSEVNENSTASFSPSNQENREILDLSFTAGTSSISHYSFPYSVREKEVKLYFLAYLDLKSHSYRLSYLYKFDHKSHEGRHYRDHTRAQCFVGSTPSPGPSPRRTREGRNAKWNRKFTEKKKTSRG